MTRRTAFTLIELLVVVAIIVALIAILLPSMHQAVYVANEAVCASNMRQVVVAHQTYGADNAGSYAPNNDGHMYYARYDQPLTSPSVFRLMVQEGEYFSTPDIMVCPLLDGMGVDYLTYEPIVSGPVCTWRYAFDNPTSNYRVWSGYAWYGGMTSTPWGLTFLDPRGSAIIPKRMAEASSSNYLMSHRMLAWGPARAYTSEQTHGGVGNTGTAPPDSFQTPRTPNAFGDGHVSFHTLDEIKPRLSDGSGVRWYYW